MTSGAQLELEGLTPEVIETPSNAREVADVLARANTAGHSVIPWGRGASMALGNLPHAYHTALVLHQMRDVFDHAPGDLTLTVSAGTLLAEINTRLADHRQCLPLDASDPARITVGGALAVGLTGPRRLGHGTLRDRLLWCQVATADGRLVESGARVVKSVAGFDLGKLHIGALGSLGVITAACFKLAPVAPERRVAVAHFDRLETCFSVLSALRKAQLSPTALSLVWEPGDAKIPDAGRLYVGLEGTAGGVAFQWRQIQTAAKSAGCRDLTDFGSRDFESTWQELLSARQSGTWQLRLMVLPSQVQALLTQLSELSPAPNHLSAELENGVVFATWAHAPAEISPSLAIIQAWVAALNGAWRIEACPTGWKKTGLDVWGPQRPDRSLMRALKKAWDPTHTLAPGRSVGG